MCHCVWVFSIGIYLMVVVIQRLPGVCVSYMWHYVWVAYVCCTCVIVYEFVVLVYIWWYLSYNACMAPDNVLAYLYVYVYICYICGILCVFFDLAHILWFIRSTKSICTPVPCMALGLSYMYTSLFTFIGLFSYLQVSFHIWRSFPTFTGLFSHV